MTSKVIMLKRYAAESPRHRRDASVDCRCRTLGSGTAPVTEIILTAALLVILGTAAASPRLVGHNSALAVGGTIALLGLIAIQSAARQ